MFRLVNKVRTILSWNWMFLLIDLFAVPISWYGAYWLRFNLAVIPQQELLHATYLLPFLIFVQVLMFWFFGLYRGIWKFASLPDFIRILKVVVIGMLLSLGIVFFAPFTIPRSIVPIYVWLLISFLGGVRVLYRWFGNHYHNAFKDGKRTLVIGAGQAADLLLRELMKSQKPNGYNVVAMLDDDQTKIGCEIHGIRVIGQLDSILEAVDEQGIECVIIAMPSASAAMIRKIVDCCKNADIEFYSVPNLSDLVNGKVTINTLREVSVEDLLGREQVTLDWGTISAAVSAKRILVSGGGGSIGSELCRQIASLAPKLLLVVDNSEFNLYTIDKELREKFPQLSFKTYLIDVTDKIAIQEVVSLYKPHIVFHAAAYKHVPLLEDQARSAIRNNVLGTCNVVQAALDYSVPTFVLISTDKAVNPTNIMGATKRAAEMVCQNSNGRGISHFITVRFGNVLDSAGSVIPLFREQLAFGKDLTVTHPEVTRYFMTISEAAQLILQATALGKNGEIFVLDMGEPIKIKALAEQMIYLSGKKLGEETKISYIGLRPGEKLNEELFYVFEALLPTAHTKIKQSKYLPLSWQEISKYINAFTIECNKGEYKCEGKLRELLFDMVLKDGAIISEKTPITCHEKSSNK